MVRQTLYFLYENGFAILFVALIFTVLMVYIVLNDIKFKTQKVKLEKVLVVEKMANPPPSLKQLNTEVENQSNNNSTCKNLNDKTSAQFRKLCMGKSTNKKNVIKKCVAARALGTGSTAAKGSDGPSDMCYCSKDGKLIPWKNCYLDGSSIKKPEDRHTKGDKYTYKN